MQKLYGTAAGISGFVAVALGAFGAHGLDGVLSAQQLQTWDTAVQYQVIHTLVLLVMVLSQWNGKSFPRATAGLFLGGILLFSGSLYLLALTGMRWLGFVTPLGGLLFLAGWAGLVRALWLR